MLNIASEQGFSMTTMLAVAAAAILLAGTFYYRTFGALKPGQWQTLLGLRIAVILLIVLLLFRPVFSYHRNLQEKKALVFLLDTSASMSISESWIFALRSIVS